MAERYKNERLYNVWYNMKSRCTNERDVAYKNYGKRGISVCKEWTLSFKKFVAWAMASGYEDGLTIERKNNNGNYSPSNCGWATPKEQAQNKRSNVIIEIGGEKKIKTEWARMFNLDPNVIQRRINKGISGISLLVPAKSGSSTGELHICQVATDSALKYRVRIWKNGKHNNVGQYETIEQAIIARDNKLKEI